MAAIVVRTINGILLQRINYFIYTEILTKLFFFHIHYIIKVWIQLENQWTSFTSEKKAILNDQMALRMAEGHE